jgi:hypothetical protein
MASRTPLLLSDRSNNRKAVNDAPLNGVLGHTEMRATHSDAGQSSESIKLLEENVLRSSNAALDTTTATDVNPAAEVPKHNNQYSKDTLVQQSNDQAESAPSRDNATTRPARTCGTPLSTILEQTARTTLDPSRHTPPLPSPTRAQGVTREVSMSLDESAMQEFRNTIASVRVEGNNLSSDATSDLPDRSILQGGVSRVAEPNYAVAFVRSATPPGHCPWPGDREPTAATNSSNPPMEQLQPPTKKGCLRSIRDYFRITIPSEHGQTAFSRDSIQAARSTTRPAWHAPRNSFNYRGKHPFELELSDNLRDGSHKPPSSCDGRNCTAAVPSDLPSAALLHYYMQSST